MKKIFVMVCILTVLAVALTGCTDRTGTWSISGSHTGMQRNITEDGVSISGRTMSGRFTTTVELKSENLTAFNVESAIGSGKASILLTQGNTERTFDISGTFNDNLDMSSFDPGLIRIRFIFESAENVDIVINWR